MKIQYKIFIEKKLIVQKMSGDWDTKTYLSYLKFITKADLSPVYQDVEKLVATKFKLVATKFSVVHLLSKIGRAHV